MGQGKMKLLVPVVAAVLLPGMACAPDGLDGGFVGVFGAYGNGGLTGETSKVELLNPEGWIVGVAAGVNVSLSNGLVVGAVGDVAMSGMVDEVVISDTLDGRSAIDPAGSFRVRAGYLVGGAMPYVTAGAAFAHHKIEQVFSGAMESASADAMHLGWTVGGGIEVLATDQLSVDVLYRYSDHGTAEYLALGEVSSMSRTAQQIGIGVNLGF